MSGHRRLCHNPRDGRMRREASRIGLPDLKGAVAMQADHDRNAAFAPYDRIVVQICRALIACGILDSTHCIPWPADGHMIEVENLESGYHRARVLFGVSFTVQAGEVVALLGRNGMGKTTTISTVMGILRPTAGQVRFAGARLDGLPSYRIARHGLGLVPEGRQVFPNLTVHENLVATASTRRTTHPTWTEDRVLQLFPPLRERRHTMAERLSGGEQQMLAIGRALMTNPRLLILDEATEGLAPLVRAEIWEVLGQLKRQGMAILLVDKNIAEITRLADRHYIIEKGRVVWTGNSTELIEDQALQSRYLGV
jgi:branched-chain amino acid transport system ATP-binding protein